MPALIYRSARVVIQNSTNTLWTLDAAELLFGSWTGPFDPYKNTPKIDAQAAIALNSHSSILHQGAEGFIRFSSSEGQLHIHWDRPWVGPFKVDASLNYDGFTVKDYDQTQMPAYGVGLVTINNKE